MRVCPGPVGHGCAAVFGQRTIQASLVPSVPSCDSTPFAVHPVDVAVSQAVGIHSLHTIWNHLECLGSWDCGAGLTCPVPLLILLPSRWSPSPGETEARGPARCMAQGSACHCGHYLPVLWEWMEILLCLFSAVLFMGNVLFTC